MNHDEPENAGIPRTHSREHDNHREEHTHTRQDDNDSPAARSGFYKTGFWIVLTNAITAISILIGSWAAGGVNREYVQASIKAVSDVRNVQLAGINTRVDMLTANQQATMNKLDSMQADVIELKTVVLKSLRSR